MSGFRDGKAQTEFLIESPSVKSGNKVQNTFAFFFMIWYSIEAEEFAIFMGGMKNGIRKNY